MKLSRVRDPLVDQDERGTVLIEQLTQNVARIGGVLVVRSHTFERLLAPQLIRELTPHRTNDCAVRLGGRIARRDLVAHQHHAFGGWEALHACFRHHSVDARQLARVHAAEQVI